MKNLTKDIENVFQNIKSLEIFDKSGLGGGIPFFIFPYNVSYENYIDNEVNQLSKRLQLEGVDVLNINIYDACVEIWNKKGGIEKMFKLEAKKKDNKAYFLKALQSSVNIQEVLMPFLLEKISNSNAKILFLTGIAQVFPFIRSHVILNNLQTIISNTPLIIFYPGEYTGLSLSLFNVLKDDNYYRAFNLKNYN
ncbi:DUF1788 domain-containing protein [Empedobacter brevis]